jgi:hypothetical protein
MSNIEEQTVQLYSNVTGSKEPGNDSGQGRCKSIQKFYDSVPATNVVILIPPWLAIWPSASAWNPLFFSPPPSCHPNGDTDTTRMRHARAIAVN